MSPSCYGQPGSSWGPQRNTAPASHGIPVYLDEGRRWGWTISRSGTAACFTFSTWAVHMRAQLDGAAPMENSYQQFDRAAAELAARGGGVISIYYHPTEFVSIEFGTQ